MSIRARKRHPNIHKTKNKKNELEGSPRLGA